jgi:hypothetical protein
MWSLAYGYHRQPSYGYEATREAAMAAFAPRAGPSHRAVYLTLVNQWDSFARQVASGLRPDALAARKCIRPMGRPLPLGVLGALGVGDLGHNRLRHSDDQRRRLMVQERD